MPDEADLANDQVAKHNSACLAGHQARRASARSARPGLEKCEECGNKIPEERRKLVPGCRLVVYLCNHYLEIRWQVRMCLVLVLVPALV